VRALTADGHPVVHPTSDATMHNPECPETQTPLSRLVTELRREAEERNKLTVGELFDSINHIRNPDVTTEKVLAVAEIGKSLLYHATCIAYEQDDADFFEEAYSLWGPLVDAVKVECGDREYEIRVSQQPPTN